MLLNHFLERTAESAPDKTAVVCGSIRMSFGLLDTRANRLAHALLDSGLERHDRAAVFLDNSPESVIAIFAILKAGGVFVVIHPQVQPKKLNYILDDCQVKVLVSSPANLRVAAATLPECRSLRTVIMAGNDREWPPLPGLRVLDFSRLQESYPSGRPACRTIDIDLASLVYTSGSTGFPKGVMLTHLNMVTAARSITRYLENTTEDIILDCLPLAFDYGLYQVLMAVKFGGTVVLEKNFTYPYLLLERMAAEHVTGLPLVPTMAVLLLNIEHPAAFNLPDLRYITNTAQALPARVIRRLRQRFPQARLYSMYGLTECKRVSYLRPEEIDRRPDSVGQAIPNTEIYLVDPSGQRIDRPDAAGELVVRGAHVMRGYWNLPQETARKLRPGRYPGEVVLHTGDLFKMDGEGYLYFISRSDDIIKTAGEMVSPREVENALYELEDVLEASVTGVEDPILGKAVKAEVVLRSGSALTENDIRQHCAGRLERYMIPKVVVFRDVLPKTLTGKIKKTADPAPEEADPCAASAAN